MADTEAKKVGFWARQFAPEATPGQNTFDLFFGVVLPAVCLFADPIVFKGSAMMGGGMFAHYAVPAYLFLGGSILAMGIWLTTRRLAILFAGPFLMGALVALGVGTALLPLSLLMVLVGIGLLGLVPFGTAFTFLRNSIRARRAAEALHPEPRVAGALLLTAALAVAVPAGAHVYVKRKVSRALAAVASDEAAVRERGLGTLRRYARVLPDGVGLDRIVWDWRAARDPARKARLAEAYEATTGRSIEDRLYELED